MIMLWHKREIWGTRRRIDEKMTKRKGRHNSKTIDTACWWKFILCWSRHKAGEGMTKKYYDHCQPDRQLMVHTYYEWRRRKPFGYVLLLLLLPWGDERHLLEFFSEVDNFFPFCSPFVAFLGKFIIFPRLRLLHSEASLPLPRTRTFRFVIYLFTYVLCPTSSFSPVHPVRSWGF